MYLYIIQSKEYLKIGIANNPRKRLRTLQTGNPHKLKILNKYYCIRNANEIEKKVHYLLKPYHVRGEWFKCTFNDADTAIKECIQRYGAETDDQREDARHTSI